MKRGLQKYSRQRLHLIATVGRFGKRAAPVTRKHNKLNTVLLTDIRLYDTDELVEQHAWLTCGQWSNDLNIGDTISFYARVQRYQKGYKGIDYKDTDVSVQDDYRLEKPTIDKILKRKKGA